MGCLKILISWSVLWFDKHSLLEKLQNSVMANNSKFFEQLFFVKQILPNRYVILQEIRFEAFKINFSNAPKTLEVTFTFST